MFYKNNKGNISKGNTIINKDYELIAEKKDGYKLPVDGWEWFETDDEAYKYFGIVKPVGPVEPIRKKPEINSTSVEAIDNNIAVLQSQIDELQIKKTALVTKNNMEVVTTK